MATGINRLTAIKVKNLSKPGRYADGGGLYLVITPAGARKWVFRYQVNGRRRDAGLGSAVFVPLVEARDAAEKARRQIREGTDPIVERRKARMIVPTFRAAATMAHDEYKPTWKNEKHAAQWLATLQQYAFATLGDVPVDRIAAEVRDTLAKPWLEVPETARRVRQRIGAVLDWSHSKGFRPTALDMRGITKGLPKQPKADRNFDAMPWQEVPSFVGALRESTATPSIRRAFEFLILTAVRSGEVRGMRWNEVDAQAKVWSVPAERMKAGKAHAIPLPPRALEILRQQDEDRSNDDPGALVFEGARAGRPMSDMTLTQLLRPAAGSVDTWLG